jgi:hypothetical protein
MWSLFAEQVFDLCRGSLRAKELAVLWFLRIYLLFMMAVVAYQAWTAAH